MYGHYPGPVPQPTPVYKKIWFWLLIVFGAFGALAAFVVILGAIILSGSDEPAPTSDPVTAVQQDSSPLPSDVPKEYQSALQRAGQLANQRHKSKADTYSLLTSDVYGFTDEAAQYAVDNVDANWKENALHQARYFQDERHKSHKEIRRLLSSDVYGFTEEEVDYAMHHLEP